MVTDRIDNAEETTLVLSDTARIEDAEALKAVLCQIVDSDAREVTLDLSQVSAVDITFYQLALVLQKTLAGKGRRLVLRSLPPDHVVQETASLLGLPLSKHFTLVEAPS